MTQPIIDAQGLSKKVGQRYLLKDITWQVQPGEHWCIFGLNGCGKTTLLSILAGFQQPTSGKLSILGQAYDDDTVFALRKRVGLVSSSYFGKIFARESLLQIVLSGLCGGFNVDRTVTLRHVRQAKALLAHFHLAGRCDQPFYQLSKGEQQNVLIARVLLAQPEILLLDELTSGLDIIARAQILETLGEIMAKTPAAVINVSHYPEEITADFSQCLLLREGQVYAAGPSAHYMQPDVLSDFLQKGRSQETQPLLGGELPWTSQKMF